MATLEGHKTGVIALDGFALQAKREKKKEKCIQIRTAKDNLKKVVKVPRKK